MRRRSRRSKNRHRAVSPAPHELRHLPKLIPRPQCWPPPLTEQNASSHNYIERQTPTALARRRPFLLISEVVDNLSVFFLAEGAAHGECLQGRRAIAEGASGIVWLATDAPPKETGKFFRDRKVIPW